MTSPAHPTGTDRVAEVATRMQAEIYINVQGDEPLIPPEAIDAVVSCLLQKREQGIGISTGYIKGATKEQEASKSVVHLVPTLDGCVLSLSRLPVPMEFRTPFKRNVHIGLYAFTSNALSQFTSWPQGPVEQAESIEIMRFLERGQRIACTEVPEGSIGVDYPEDIARVEARLKKNANS